VYGLSIPLIFLAFVASVSGQTQVSQIEKPSEGLTIDVDSIDINPKTVEVKADEMGVSSGNLTINTQAVNLTSNKTSLNPESLNITPELIIIESPGVDIRPKKPHVETSTSSTGFWGVVKDIFDIVLGILDRNAQTVQNSILAATLGTLILTLRSVRKYTEEAGRQTEEAEKQTEGLRQSRDFDSITRIHKTLAKIESYKAREYINNRCLKDLKKAFKEKTKGQIIENPSEFERAVELVFEGIPEKDIPEFKRVVKNVSKESEPIDLVNRVLVDFDIIALPIHMGVEPETTWKLAKAYKEVLRNTAKALIPFVDIQTRLRGDAPYREPYLYLLDKLMIPLPDNLKPGKDHLKHGLYPQPGDWKQEEYTNPFIDTPESIPSEDDFQG
jgi:hypothetical protein